jgi:hypothetical protein
MKTIKVVDCANCPFNYMDNMICYCSASNEIDLKWSLVKDKGYIPSDCPLRVESITVERQVGWHLSDPPIHEQSKR